jgi:flavorubredoxin
MNAIDRHEDAAVDEIADGIYRLSCPLDLPDGHGFSFNQYLVVDDAPLLYHTGPKRLFAQVRAAVGRVMPVERLRYISFSHFEADECGALNEFLALAPAAEPLCGRLAANVSVNDYASRAPRVLADGEELPLGRHRVRWLDAPHVPHAWENGFLFETGTATLFCSDLFTQPGARHPALTTGDILGPSEALRARMDFYAHSRDTRRQLERLAATRPATLACMHGSAWSGDGAGLIGALADRLGA